MLFSPVLTARLSVSRVTARRFSRAQLMCIGALLKHASTPFCTIGTPLTRPTAAHRATKPANVRA